MDGYLGKPRRLVACRQERVDELREDEIECSDTTFVVGPQFNVEMVVADRQKWVMINLFGQRNAGRCECASDVVANWLVQDQMVVGE